MRKIARFGVLTTFLCVASLATVTTAFGAKVEKTYIPPGAAGTSQYYQDIQTAKGAVAPPSRGTTGSGSTLSSTGSGAKGSAALAKLGQDGTAAANFAKATAPATSGAQTASKSSNAAAGKTKGSAAVIDNDASSGGLASFLAGQSQGGLGVFLPLIMIVSLVGAIVYALARRRSASTV